MEDTRGWLRQNPPPPAPPHYAHERGWEMAREFMDGATYREIAERHGLSSERVKKLIERYVSETVEHSMATAEEQAGLHYDPRFPPRIRRVLWHNGYRTDGDVAQATDLELLNGEGIGKTALAQIRAVIPCRNPANKPQPARRLWPADHPGFNASDLAVLHDAAKLLCRDYGETAVTVALADLADRIAALLPPRP